GVGILVRIDAIRRANDRNDFLAPEIENEFPEHRIGRGVADRRITCETAEIGQRRMRAIEHAQYQPLIRGNVIDELRTGFFQGGTIAPDKAVLDHPLAKRLMADRY